MELLISSSAARCRPQARAIGVLRAESRSQGFCWTKAPIPANGLGSRRFKSSQAVATEGALEGIKILDLSRVLAVSRRHHHIGRSCGD